MQTTSPASLNLALSEALSRNLPDTAMKAGFNSGVLEDYRPDELAGMSAAGLVRVLGEFWRFGEAAGEAGLRIRLTEAQGDGGFRADLLEIVQPDAPYLVDSVMGELGDLGVQIIAMFHPVVQSPSGPLSMIQVWLAPAADDVQARLLDNVRAALADTHAAIDDAAALKALLAGTIAALPPASPAEDVRFLQWLQAGWFVLLGARTYDYPRNPDGDYAAEEPVFDPAASLGVLRDPARSVLRRTSEPAVLSARLRNRLERTDAVVVAKSNLRSRVHRHAYMDYIGVRRTGADGTPSGEVRFVGLFTAGAYDQPARDTPLLRGKIAYVLAAAGFDAGSHNALRLANILETYPRDELFQIAPGDLLTSALDILHLYDRPKVKLFVRRDPFDRFVSVLFYAPRERYDARLRERVGEFLAKAFRGRVSAYYPRYSDDALARVHFIIGTTPGDTAHPDLAELEAQATNAARSWSDDFDTAVRASALVTPVAWEGAFPAGYRDRYDGAEAMADVLEIEALTTHQAVGVRAFRTGADSALQFRLKLYRRGDEPLHLSRVLPILQDMGLSALMEDGFVVTPRSANGGRDAVRIHDFILEDTRGDKLSFEAIKRPFEAAFTAVWSGQFESDGFNRLVLELGASLRQAALVRALARYRQQSGLDPSPLAQQAAVAAHPDVVRLILALFASRFDPATDNSREQRIAAGLEITGAIDQALQAVESLDEDRVLRRIAALVEAITRTNYYQPGPGGTEKPYISFKIASRTLTDLPAPKPYREIFVSGPNVEGVHLRFGPVARGGLRWSDRRDDFRTEVLGLVKAQQVKNAVIVPVGSKGGFFPKQLPRGGPPEAIRAEAISAYKTFLSGLLDLTDNRAVDGTVVQPLGVVAYDGEDPYLVVAADKGTATFSDIANGVAADYGFWLGDAFASGGSAGYDHKVMGITARGAWESVKRHFRELGKDIQRDPVSVIGVGDMSGDVFGNGMLLSKTLRLVAGFDHRHIFLDPDPDPAEAWRERERLFALPRSSWDDYDRSKISRGGGVFARSLKSIPLSESVRALLDVKAAAMAPSDLIRAILLARADLLYLGGIGTYVKSLGQSNVDVGDKANDAVRVNGRDLRCKVVGEGANLGFTQAGRIEFALAGGRINTDAIDNSAGVDTSDHEVNIKILAGMAVREGALAPGDRDPLLASLTDEVADHVLAHNYDQTLTLSILEAGAAGALGAQKVFMTDLEKRGRLDRTVEGLPDDGVIAERAMTGKGLTRPELSVLLAYGKLELFDDMIASTAPDDPYFLTKLEAYFPKALSRFSSAMQRHPLRREIIATVMTNDLVNRLGPTFPARLRRAAGCDTRALVSSFEAARQILRLSEVRTRVAALDGKAPAAAQLVIFRELSSVVRGLTYWLARRGARDGADVRSLISAYQPAMDAVKRIAPGVLSPFEQKAAVRRAAVWIKAGAPKNLAHSVALMRPLSLIVGLADLASARGWSWVAAAHLHHRVGGVFGFDRLRAAAGQSAGSDAYERLAVRRLIEDLVTQQAALTDAVMTFRGSPTEIDSAQEAGVLVNAWSASRGEAVRLARRTLEEIERSAGGWTFAKLTIANAALRALATGQ